MTESNTTFVPPSEDLDRLMAEHGRRRLERLLTEALAGYPPEQARSLRERLPATIELRRFEHGGEFVSVLMNGEWLPLERALSALARIASEDGGPDPAAES